MNDDPKKRAIDYISGTELPEFSEEFRKQKRNLLLIGFLIGIAHAGNVEISKISVFGVDFELPGDVFLHASSALILIYFVFQFFTLAYEYMLKVYDIQTLSAVLAHDLTRKTQSELDRAEKEWRSSERKVDTGGSQAETEIQKNRYLRLRDEAEKIGIQDGHVHLRFSSIQRVRVYALDIILPLLVGAWGLIAVFSELVMT